MMQTLAQMPSAETLYLKAATTIFRKPKGKPVLPALALELKDVAIDPEHLAEYRSVCGFAEGEFLPISFPHVVAGALHLQLMTSPEFPLPLLGLVHIRNRCTQTRGLKADERFDVLVRLGDAREVRQGLEFDFLTEFSSQGSPVWSETSTILYRMPGPKGPAARPAAPLAQLADYQTFEVPGDIGRRYAKVGRDYNPIHLAPWTAKLFGFPRHIAHGMWSVARCAATLEAQLGGRVPAELDVQFKQPLLLPARVTLKSRGGAAGLDYALLSRNSDKVHLTGSLR
ncbi:MAG TPA: MaoC/PaaZ C-terminal domain-containing protein [Solimonas sp.]|nr:MaoC/PaaZ C-terminal domain-containing protein [Solimonas sp.]